MKRRERLDLVVKREDDLVEDIGTVLVLTRPREIMKGGDVMAGETGFRGEERT